MNLPDRAVTAFLVLADELHFGRAAARLRVSQPSLSRQIAGLERRLGVTLLRRTSRRVALTAAGAAFLAHARDAEQSLARALSAARRAAAGESGELDVGFVSSAAYGPLVGALAELRRRHPDIIVRLHERMLLDQIDDVASGRLDITVVRGHAAPAGLALEPMLSEPLCAVLPGGHPLAGRRRVDLADLADADFILWPRALSPSAFDAIVSACEAAGFTPRIVWEVVTAPSILALVSAGFGVSLLAKSYRAIERPGAVLVPLVSQQTTTSAVYREGDASPALLTFLGLLRRRAQWTAC